jgi:uncharacterized protein (DUF433 family)
MWDHPRTRAFEEPEDRHECPAKQAHRGTGHGPGWDEDDAPPERLWGEAVTRIEQKGGRWWLHNFEYSSEASYCPWCGLRLGGDDGSEIAHTQDVRQAAIEQQKRRREEIRRRVARGEIPALPDLTDEEAGAEAVELVRASRQKRQEHAQPDESGLNEVPPFEFWLESAREIAAILKTLEPGSEVIVSGRIDYEVLVVVEEIPDTGDLTERRDALEQAIRDLGIEPHVEIMGQEAYEMSKNVPGTYPYQVGYHDPRRRMDMLIREVLERPRIPDPAQGELFRAMRRFDSAVSRDPAVHSGDLVFRGTRVPVSDLADILRHGGSLEEFLDGYPTVAKWQVEAVLDLYRETDVISTTYDAALQRLARGEDPADWKRADVGREALCDRCGEPGKVIVGWPSMGEASPIVARCRRHVPEDDWT